MTSTQILAESSRLIALLLIDSIQVYDVGAPVTSGITVTKELTPVGQPIDALVQAVTLENAVESRVNTSWSVKVRQGVDLREGQAIKVLRCAQEPTLVNRTLMLDKVSENGMAILRKAVASSFSNVNQEGTHG